MSDQETIDTVEDTAAAAIKRRYQKAIALPPDDLVKIIAEKLAEGVERTCRFPPMLYHQVQGRFMGPGRDRCHCAVCWHRRSSLTGRG
jgi:hypothetical protein